jgi:HTH-type transcriptional regulator/antitoxin MqsA
MDRVQKQEAEMKCEVCGIGERQDTQIDYSLLLDDKFVVVEHVPAAVCDRCGETSLTPDVVARLQQTLWRSHAPVKTLETPVYEFATGD